MTLDETPTAPQPAQADAAPARASATRAVEAGKRIERALEDCVRRCEAAPAPAKLAATIRYAVFPGGARVRPRLVVAVAKACGDDLPAATEAAAAAVELMHCASLVHDDLPCFDDAATRRGRAAAHKRFSEPLALLAGDAMIVSAFEAVALGGAARPERAIALALEMARAVGMPSGIVAGQGFESETAPDVAAYHAAKTGALFVGATAMGAAAAGASPEPWRRLGACLGEAYQVADDIRDVAEAAEAMGKPVGQDAALGRPSAVAAHGLDGALRRLRRLVEEAVASIPACDGAEELRELVMLQAKRLTPKHLAQSAA